MRTLIHAAFLAGLLVPACLAQSAMAADLDYGYEPRPVPVLPPPPPPPCGVYRPCFRPYLRFGYAVPRPYRFGYARPYARFGYGGGYGYNGPREHVAPYGRDHYGYEEHGYAPREHVERYGEGRPYADPLGHDRQEGRDRFEGRERLDRYGDDERRREGEGFDRSGEGRGFRGEPGPYDRG